MIAPLRRRHRLLAVILLTSVPVLYVIALAARPAVPVQEPLPPALAETTLVEVTHERLEVFGEFSVRTRIGKVPSHSAARRLDTQGRQGDRLTSVDPWAVELTPVTAIARPEVLVYWTPSAATGDGLPDGAYLLGHLAGRRPRALALPPAVLGRAGHLTLYSLGHQEILGTAELPAVGPPPAVHVDSFGEEEGR